MKCICVNCKNKLYKGKKSLHSTHLFSSKIQPHHTSIAAVMHKIPRSYPTIPDIARRPEKLAAEAPTTWTSSFLSRCKWKIKCSHWWPVSMKSFVLSIILPQAVAEALSRDYKFWLKYMFMKYLEGLKPIKITAGKKRENEIYFQ